MNEPTVQDALIAQFDDVWDMLRDGVGGFGPDQWMRREGPAPEPVRQAYHAAGAADMYCCEGDFAWDGRFRRADGRFDWDGLLVDPPSQEEFLGYVEEVQARVEVWLIERGNEAFLGALQERRHEGETYCERALYVLRHCQHHVAELNAELRHRHLPCAKWR